MSGTVETVKFIKHTIQERDFDLVYMPVCDLRLGKVHHFEAPVALPRPGKIAHDLPDHHPGRKSRPDRRLRFRGRHQDRGADRRILPPRSGAADRGQHFQRVDRQPDVRATAEHPAGRTAGHPEAPDVRTDRIRRRRGPGTGQRGDPGDPREGFHLLPRRLRSRVGELRLPQRARGRHRQVRRAGGPACLRDQARPTTC